MHVTGLEQLDWSCLAKAYHADKRTQTIITALEDPLSAEHYRHKYHYDTDTQKLMLTGSFGADARVVVPICDDTVKLRRQLIALHHDLPCMGHYSHAGTYRALHKRYFWRGMASDVQEYVSQCDKCLKAKETTKAEHQPMRPLEVPPLRPMASLHVDFITHLPDSFCTVQNRVTNGVCVYRDHLSRKLRMLACHDTDGAQRCARDYMEYMFRDYGLP